MDIAALLRDVAAGRCSAEDALARMGAERERDLGFARIDLDRPRRCGIPEVILAEGKTPAQVTEIVGAMAGAGQPVMATRATWAAYEQVRAAHVDAVYHEAARCITLDRVPLPEPRGLVAVVTAGTSDLPVAEEAALTAVRMGARVERVYDCGVAGLHRVVRHVDRLSEARAVVVVAGMEGALPSVVGGLIDRPIIAVPTSVGYGMNLKGLSALLGMLNACVPGITVVNVDNGFGAGVAAARINRLGAGA